MRRVLPYVASVLIITVMALAVCLIIANKSGTGASGNSGSNAEQNHVQIDGSEDSKKGNEKDSGSSGTYDSDSDDELSPANQDAPQSNSTAENPDDSQSNSISANPENSGARDNHASPSAPDNSETSDAPASLTTPENSASSDSPASDLPESTSTSPIHFRDPDHIVNLDTTLYTYDMMAEDLQYLAAAHPDIMELTSIGTTADGRALYTVYFGNRAAGRQIFIGAATHGREYMTTQLVMKQLEFYSAHYYDASYNGVALSDIFARTCFVIVPMINPDGVSISQLGEQGIRRQDLLENIRAIYASDIGHGYTSLDYATYLVRWKANAQGVDLNRNFSPGWESVNERVNPSSDFYKGATPGDQAESAALMGLMNTLSNPLLAISYHSYGDLVYYQYGQQGELYARSEQLATHIHNLTGHYLAGYSNEAGFTNWCVHVRGIPAVVIETGTVPTPLPLSQFADLWTKHQWMWAMLGTIY